MPVEEVARQLILEGRRQQEPSSVLVADMLDTLEAEEESMAADEPSEDITLPEYEIAQSIEIVGAVRPGVEGQGER